MDKQFNDLIMTELDTQLNMDMLELYDNYDNDETYELSLEIEKLLKAEGL